MQIIPLKACVGQLDFERIWVKNPFRFAFALILCFKCDDFYTLFMLIQRTMICRSNLAPPMLESLADMQTQYGWTFNRSEDAEWVSWSRLKVFILNRCRMMVVEEPPAGTEPHPEVTRCIATSCWEGKRIVKIDLVKEGIPVSLFFCFCFYWWIVVLWSQYLFFWHI